MTVYIYMYTIFHIIPIPRFMHIRTALELAVLFLVLNFVFYQLKILQKLKPIFAYFGIITDNGVRRCMYYIFVDNYNLL